MNSSKTYHVYFLGGQSNMDGYGFTQGLPAELNKSIPEIPIFAGLPVADGDVRGGTGVWQSLSPGFGTGFDASQNDVKLSDRFGPELTFGIEMMKRFPDRNIAIIKYARGGSSLAMDAPNYGTWSSKDKPDNNLNQYDFFLNTVRNAFSVSDLDGDGHNDVLVPAGIAWMQGEADAINEGPARVYQDNLNQTMNLIRAALRYDDLPVVIGKITDSGMDEEDGQVMDFIELVHAGQRGFVSRDPCAAYVTEIDAYNHIEDGWHYDSEAYIKMGKAFANAMVDLEERCSPVK